MTNSANNCSDSIKETCTLPWGSRSKNNCFWIPSGRISNTANDSAVKPFLINSYFSVQVSNALNLSAFSPANNSLISAINTENSGTNSTIPSGIIATPKLSPLAARAATESAIWSAIWESDIFLAATSSPIKQMFGCVSNAHSNATWEAERPMTLMKCQYFLAEFASRSMFPINSLYVFVAVSNPKEHSISSFFKSPSMVLGQPTTWTPVLCAAKYSAKTAALVLESSPPIMTIALIPCFLQTSAACANCSSVSNFVRPEPMISNPPVLRNWSMYSSSNTIYLSSVNPLGPPLNPYNTFSLFVAFKASYKPQTTLCPPGAWPPDRITPTTCFLAGAVFVPFSKVISFLPYVLGNKAEILSWSATLCVGSPSFTEISAIPLRSIPGNLGWYFNRSIWSGEIFIVYLLFYFAIILSYSLTFVHKRIWFSLYSWLINLNISCE